MIARHAPRSRASAHPVKCVCYQFLGRPLIAVRSKRLRRLCIGAALAGVKGAADAVAAATGVVRVADRGKFEALSGSGGALKRVLSSAVVIEDRAQISIMAQLELVERLTGPLVAFSVSLR